MQGNGTWTPTTNKLWLMQHQLNLNSQLLIIIPTSIQRPFWKNHSAPPPTYTLKRLSESRTVQPIQLIPYELSVRPPTPNTYSLCLQKISWNHWRHHHHYHTHFHPSKNTTGHDPHCTPVTVPNQKHQSICPAYIWLNPRIQRGDACHTIVLLHYLQHPLIPW